MYQMIQITVHMLVTDEIVTEILTHIVQNQDIVNTNTMSEIVMETLYHYVKCK